MRYIWTKLLDLKIRYKLLGVYLLATVIPIMLVGAYLNFGMRDVVLNNTLYETEANLEKIEMQLDTVLSRITKISDLIYLNRDMDTLLNEDYQSLLEIYDAYNQYPIFDEYLKYYDEIETIQFYMSKEMITNSYFIHANEEIVQQDWYKEAVQNQGRIIWRMKEEEWTKQEYLALTRAVYDRQNQFLGVLSIYVSQDKLREIVGGLIHDVYLLLDEETVIYHRNPTLIGSKQTIIPDDILGEEENYVIDHHYGGEDIKLNVHHFTPDKALQNQLQIASVIPVEKMMLKPNQIFTRGYLMIFGALACSIVSFQLFTRTFNTRINTLKYAMSQVAKGRFNIRPSIKGNDEIGEAYHELYMTSQSIQKLIDEVYVHKIKEERWRRKQKDSEFKMLSSQINPHFLYNTLEMIRMKAVVNKDRDVAALITKLSKMMRSALESTDRPVPLTNELNLVENYLEIQTMRFGDQLNYQINIKCDATKYDVFPLLIQPLVENAIIHGLEPKLGVGNLILTVEETDQHVVISVEDDGVGMSGEKLRSVQQRLEEDDQPNSKRIGVRNVHQRIQLYYGEAYGLEVRSQLEGGTTIRLVLPKA